MGVIKERYPMSQENTKSEMNGREL